MSHLYSSALQSSHRGTRDSLELGSLASSDEEHESLSHRSSSSSRPSLSSSRKASLEQDDPLDDSNPAAAAANRGHTRSYSVSSTFDFAGNLFPLSSTADGAGGDYLPLGETANGHGGTGPTSSTPRLGGGTRTSGRGRGIGASGGGGRNTTLEKHKTLTYLNGLSLIVGLIIGSGIFSAPSQVNSKIGSPGAGLVVWVIAGVLAWTGAASYAELGGAIPLNGGAQVYLAKILGELSGFLFTWVAVLVLKPGSAAIISIIMGEYLVRAAVGAEAEELSPWVNKTVALIGLVMVTFLNSISTRLGTRVNDALMLLKFVALLGVTVIGIVVAATGFSYDGAPTLDWKTHDWFEGTTTDVSAWAVALYAGLWAYDGWDNTNYVVGEFRNPTRDLPRVIHTAMPLVISSYCLANISYFLVLPLATINSSNTVAVKFGSKVFGPIGALVFALIVSASCFGALNSSTFTSSRLVYVAGKEGYIPAIFGRIGVGGSSSSRGSHHRPEHLNTIRTRSWVTKKLRSLIADDEDTALFYTPVYSLILNCTLTAAYVLVGEFGTLLTFYGVAGYTFYFLTVLALIILRVKEPTLERPYKTWITTPIIFCCVSLFLLSRAVFAQPLQTLIVVGFVVAGIPVYFWRIRGRDRVGKREGMGAAIFDPHEGDGLTGAPRPPWYKFWQRWRK